MTSYPVKRALFAAMVVSVLGGLLVGSALGQWQVASADGQSSVKLGFLIQGRAEWMVQGSAGAGTPDWTSQNLYLRRLRLIAGGTLNSRLSFFGDTDCPNSGKVASSGTNEKEFADLYIQDFAVTWSVNDRLRVDTGLLLTPGSYNHLQSAASLLTIDYGPYTFIETGPMKGKVGRDTGATARGLLAGKHVEYRIGCFQGLRKGRATQPFRAAGRLTLSPLALTPGLFYPGTSFGKKQSVGLGLGFDAQSDYKSATADIYVDQPLAGGIGVTFQADVARYDGGDFLPAIAPQTNFMVELGVSILDGRMTPFGQLARQEFDRNGQDETAGQLGLCWWLDGHKANLKAGWTRFDRDTAAERNQFQLQYQAFVF